MLRAISESEFDRYIDFAYELALDLTRSGYPTYTDGMLGMLSLFGVDNDALESLMPFASQILAQYSSTDIGKVKLTLRELTVNGDNGTVRYEVDMKFKDGGKNSLTDTANIVKVKGKWYFSAY